MSDERTNKRRPWWHGAVAATGIAAFIVLLIWGPWWVEGNHLRDKSGELVSSAGIIVTGFRTMLVAIVAGGLTAAGLVYTHRSHQHTVAKDREQAALTREGQVTDRYVEAIKLLACKNLTERLGAIYALERIIRDSEGDREAIQDVIAAFVRGHTTEGGGVDQPEAEIALGVSQNKSRTLLRAGFLVDVEGWMPTVRPPEDLQAAATVLARHFRHGDRSQLNLGRSELRGIQLSGARLVKANLFGADLRAANLADAWLEGAMLIDADLRDASLDGADLRGAYLHSADLQGARLRFAKFKGATLDGTRLDGADLSYTEGLRVEQLVMADLGRATRLPEELAQHPEVKARMAECEAARANDDESPPAGESTPAI
ncbi:pentapeptide repeat-containing protein [Streptomyces sp. NPDC051664]|uniref:pentapeptide repeat-containing protein n=1 Tax=Streptomyces sp. NPDC051664 TaxID=3365668 RepID=UPI003795E4D2